MCVFMKSVPFCDDLIANLISFLADEKNLKLDMILIGYFATFF